eukprot:12083-Heterococcus_DN1.PRE.1
MTAHRSIILLGTSSIGAALSKRLAAKGFALHFAGRREDALKALVQQYRGSSYSMIDAMEPATIEQAVADAAAAAKAADGHLVGLAYLCGSIPLKSLRASKAVDFTDAYMVNVVSAAMSLKAAAPHMAKAPGGGSAVFFSSVAASVGFPQHSAIASAKAGLEGLTRSAAAELSPITRVNAIAPSLTDTPLASRLLASQAGRDALAKLHPLGRVGTADDHASLASWLLDSSESGWVTGQVFGCDGARKRQWAVIKTQSSNTLYSAAVIIFNIAIGNFLSNFYRMIVIGDLPEHEAEQFLFNALLSASAHSNALSGIESSVSDEAWKRIYEVCSGNSGALLAVVDEYSRDTISDWNKALMEVLNVPWQSVLAAASGRTGLWTAPQYAEGALLLLDSAHSDAVLEKHMKVALGSTITSTINGQEAAGRTVLAAIVRANMLIVRPYSLWCCDVPIAAKMLLNQPSPIVTAPSAAEFYCMSLKQRQHWHASAAVTSTHKHRVAAPTSIPI